MRTPEFYLAIAHRHFSDASATVLHDLLAVPYTHCIMEARAPLAAKQYRARIRMRP